MSQKNSPDFIPSAVMDVINLYTEELAEVKFPDVHKGLMEELVEKVQAGSERVEEARVKLEEARQDLTEQQEELKKIAEKGLAYARVFSQGNPELEEKLKNIKLGPEEKEKTRKKRKKRPVSAEKMASKSNGKNSAELPFTSENEAVKPAPAEQN